MLIDSITFLVVLGISSGFLSGLLGIGGGIFLVPLLSFMLVSQGFSKDISLKVAIATSIAIVAISSLVSVYVHSQQKTARWDVLTALSPGVLIGAVFGAQITVSLPNWFLAWLFAIFTFFSATRMFYENTKSGKDNAFDRKNLWFLNLLGMSIGMISIVLGVGGGALWVPFFLKNGLTMQESAATSSACTVPTALAGIVGYLFAGWSLHFPGCFGFFYLKGLLFVGGLSVLTASFGAKTAHRLSPKLLKQIFAGLFYIVSLYMFWKGLHE